MSAPAKPRRRWREALSLPKVEKFSSALRTMFINIGFFAATILLIPAVGSEFTRSAVVIEPIAVPKALVERGLTPEVVANRLWDGLQDFARSASAARETIVSIPDSQLIEFSLPDSAISIESVFTQIRLFFNIHETRIGGEFLCATPACEPEGLRLRLRIVRTNSDVVDLPELGSQTEQQYYREAAAGIFAIIDPYVAIAAQAETAPLRAATLARGLIADGAKDAKWAHNLIGDIERKSGENDLAAAEYQAALALDPKFHIARANLALALGAAGRTDAARAELEELERRSPGNTLAPLNFAALAMMVDDREEAIRWFLVAAAREPLEPGHLAAAGQLALEMGRFDEGVEHLREALSIDPGHGGALDILAEALWGSGDTAGAEALYRQWLDYEPENTDARTQLAMILFSAKQYEAALAQFDTLLTLADDPGPVRLLRGAALFQLKRYPEAIAALAPVAAETADPDALALLYKSYQAAGQRQDATRAIEAYLAAAPAEHAGRLAAEAALADLRRDGGG